MAEVRAAAGFLLLLAGVASAQGRATLVDAPLMIRVPMPAEEAHALQSDFRQTLARNSAVLLPTGSTWKAAVAGLDTRDCEVRDECLQRLARATSSLYAIFASVERNAAGTELIATGRLVSQDGQRIRAPVRVVGATSGASPVLGVLQRLVSRLELEELKAVLPQPGAPPPLPTVEAEAGPAPARVTAWVTLGVASFGAGLSLGAGLMAMERLSELPGDGRPITDAQVQARISGDRAATLSLVAGAGAGAMLITSLVLFSASSPVKVAAVPTAGGGVAMISGRF